jgi:hypothetical protein
MGEVAHSALAALTADDRAVVLAELLRVHPTLTAEAEQLARSLLELSDRDSVATEVTATLLALNLEDLAARAGPQWGGGYVEPHEAADELLAEAVQPYLDDLKRRAKAGSRHAATEIGLGLLLSLYARRDVDDNDLLLTHAGMPDAVDDLAWQVRSAMTASGLEMPEGWLAEECPDWQP